MSILYNYNSSSAYTARNPPVTGSRASRRPGPAKTRTSILKKQKHAPSCELWHNVNRRRLIPR